MFTGDQLQDLAPKPLAIIRDSPLREDPDHVGRWLASGDLDGDLQEDLVIGAPDWRPTSDDFDAGRAFAWSGSAANNWPITLTVDSAEWTIDGTEPFQRVGRAPWVEDLDGDGRADLVLPTRTLPPAP